MGIRRQKKSDPLTGKPMTPDEVKCGHAVSTFDRASREMDKKWGIDVLPELVSPELAAKFGSALAKLDAALEVSDVAETIAQAGSCMRGLVALEQEAISLGHKPQSSDVWEIQLGDFKIGLIRDNEDWRKINRPDLKIFTLREAALALKSYANVVPLEAVKENFPGAECQNLPEPLSSSFWGSGDKIPW